MATRNGKIGTVYTAEKLGEWEVKGSAELGKALPEAPFRRFQGDYYAEDTLMEKWLSERAPGELDVVDMAWRPITYSQLRVIGTFTKLWGLGLSSVDLKSSYLGQLSELQNLHRLRIRHNNLTTLSELPILTSLESLDISDNLLNDDELKEVAQFPKLQNLDISKTKVTGTGLHRLAHSGSLRVLFLCHSQATGDGLEVLKAVKNLEHLDLSFSDDISSAAVEPLCELKQLKKLILYRTRLTEPEVWQIHKSLPQCKIISDWSY